MRATAGANVSFPQRYERVVEVVRFRVQSERRRKGTSVGGREVIRRIYKEK
jgi:hypothetical protein